MIIFYLNCFESNLFVVRAQSLTKVLYCETKKSVKWKAYEQSRNKVGQLGCSQLLLFIIYGGQSISRMV